ncbi:MAG: SpoIID/LytB domain-containing protein [Firmicutes bacterium]|nr:SpoIID/LytB domain-containing protein [Bacillota bacterium]
MMRKIHLASFFVIASFTAIIWNHISSIAAAPGPVMVKVGLATLDSEIILPIKGPEKLLDLSASAPRNIPLPGDQVIVSGVDGVLFLNNIPVGAGPVALIPNTEPLTWNSRSYRGVFLITFAAGKLHLINQLSLEDYLKGVVPKEMIPGWPTAALKAQAIAARTYAIASLGRHGSSGFDLCASEHCQVYGGLGVEQPGANAAVAETAGEVISFKGKIASAFFHAASGGMTKDAGMVWDKAVPYLKPALDWDQNSPYAHWTRTFTWDEIQVKAGLAYPKLGRLAQIIPVNPVKEGEKPKVTLVGDFGELAITFEDFRILAGLPSSNFELGVLYGPAPYITLWWALERKYPEAVMASQEIPGAANRLNPPWDLPDPWSWLRDKDPVKLIIRGSGWGHGVGLSQWGAKGMAEAGFNAYQIIAHYYPGTVVTKIENLK